MFFEKTVEELLIENSDKMNISVDELIVRYLKRGLFTDDYYEPPKRTREELLEMSKREAEKDRARGIPYKKTRSQPYNWYQN